MTTTHDYIISARDDSTHTELGKLHIHATLTQAIAKAIAHAKQLPSGHGRYTIVAAGDSLGYVLAAGNVGQ